MSDSTSDASPFPFPCSEEESVFTSIDLDDPVQPAEPSPAPQPSPEPRSLNHTDVPPVARLSILRAGTEQANVDVRPPRCVIGSGNADVIVDDEFVSPWHAQLYVENGGLVLEDMNSYNGVFLRIADELTLEDRDEIVMGQQRFVFRSKWEEETTADRPDRTVPRLGAPMAGSPVRLLRVLEGGRVGDIYPIGDRLTIGSGSADVLCPEDLAMSAPHAEILRDGETFILSDLQSEFGTFIRIHNTVELVDGDSFVVGQTQIDLTYV